MLFIFDFPPEIRDVFAFYILVGLVILIFQYIVKFIWNGIARLIAKIKGEEYHPPPF